MAETNADPQANAEPVVEPSTAPAEPTATPGQGDNPPNPDEALVGRLRGQRDHWRKKAERLETTIESALEADTPTGPAPAPATPTDTTAPAEVTREDFEKLQSTLSLKSEGYSDDEVQEITKYAAGAGISLQEASKNEFVQAAIQAARDKAQLEAGTLPPSGRSGSISVDEKTPRDMTPQEHRSNMAKMRAQAIEARTGKVAGRSRA